MKRSLTKTAIFYSMLSLGDMLMWNVVNNWLMYFYLSESSLVPNSFFSAIIFFNGLTSVVIALPVGYWSDHIRSRWGRRLPVLFVMALPRLLLFVLLWTPPSRSESFRNVIYLALVSLGHEITSVLHQIPGKALLPEIARTDQERVRISAWVEGFLLIGVVVGSIAGPLIERFGYVQVALLYAAISFPLFYLPLLVLREPPTDQRVVSKPIDFRQSLSLTLHNRTFLIFVAIHALITSSITLIQMMFPFIVTEILGLTMGDTVYFYLSGLLATLICYPLVTWLAKRFGKRRIFAGSLLATTLVLPGLLFLGDWLSVPLLLPGIVWVVLQAMALAGPTVLQPAFIAEVIDSDAEKVGERREGAYYADLDFIDRIIYGVAGVVPSLFLLLGRGGADPRGPLGIRIVGVAGSIFTLAALLLLRRYPHLEKQPAAT